MWSKKGFILWCLYGVEKTCVSISLMHRRCGWFASSKTPSKCNAGRENLRWFPVSLSSAIVWTFST